MVPERLDRTVFVAVVENRTIITAQQHQRVFVEIAFLERLDQFPQRPIQFDDCISARTVGSGTGESFVNDTRDMDRMRTEIQKERIFAMISNPLIRFSNPVVREVLIAEASLMAPGIESDPTHTVMDRRVVTVGPVHFQLVPMGDSRGVILAGLGITDPEWIGWIEPQDPIVMDEDLGNPVVGRGHQQAVIESKVQWSWPQGTVPIRTFWASESKVPFADDRRFVAGGLEQASQGRGSGRDDRGAVWGGHPGPFLSKRVAAREQRVARWGASRGRAISAGKSDPLRGESIDVGGRNGLRTVASDIPIAKIIGKEHDDIGARRSLERFGPRRFIAERPVGR